MHATLSARAHRNRTRRLSSPVKFRQEQAASVKDGGLFIKDIFLPPEVAPGGTIEAEFTASNGHVFICADDPDCCGPDCIAGSGTCSALNGYRYVAAVEPDWADSEEFSGCIGTTEWGTIDQTFDRGDGLSWQAPDNAGSYTVTFVIGSGRTEEFDTVDVEIAVVEGGPVSPDARACNDEGDCPDGYTCQDGTCVEKDSNGGGGDPISILLSLLENLPLILALILLIFVAQAFSG